LDAGEDDRIGASSVGAEAIKTEVFAALDELAEQVATEADSAPGGSSGSGVAAGSAEGGWRAPRDQMDHKTGRLRLARTCDHSDHNGRVAGRKQAGQWARFTATDQPGVGHGDPCSNKGRVGWGG